MHPTAANSEKVAKKVSRGQLSSFSRLAVVLYWTGILISLQHLSPQEEEGVQFFFGVQFAD